MIGASEFRALKVGPVTKGELLFVKKGAQIIGRRYRPV